MKYTTTTIDGVINMLQEAKNYLGSGDYPVIFTRDLGGNFFPEDNSEIFVINRYAIINDSNSVINKEHYVALMGNNSIKFNLNIVIDTADFTHGTYKVEEDEYDAV